MAPLQLGVGVRGGAQSVGHAVRAAAAADPASVVIQLDWANAFNSVRRAALLPAVQERAPALLRYAQYVYRLPAELHVHGAPAGTAPIESQCGVRQGDPVSGQLFGFTLQPALQDTQQEQQQLFDENGAGLVAFHDDCTIRGSPATAMRAFRTLVAAAAPSGLHPQLPKCVAYSADSAAAAAVAEELGIAHAEAGVVVTGTPIGTPQFQSAHVQQTADKVCKLIDTLMSLPLPAQDQFLVLTMSLQRRMMHFARVLEWEHISEHMKRTEAAAVAAVRRLIRLHPGPGEGAADQMVLPSRLGGLGLLRTAPEVGTAAYIAAAALCEVTFREDGPPCFRPFSGPSGTRLSQLWQLLHDSLRLWPEPDRALDPTGGTIAIVLPTVQPKVTHAIAQRRYDALLAANDLTTAVGERAAARLRSCACRESAIWLDTLPVAPSLQLSNVDFAFSLRHRCGISPMHVNARGVTCKCGQFILPDDLDHAMTCKSLSGIRTVRHNILQERWRGAGSRASVSSTKVPNTRCFLTQHAQELAGTDAHAQSSLARRGDGANGGRRDPGRADDVGGMGEAAGPDAVGRDTDVGNDATEGAEHRDSGQVGQGQPQRGADAQAEELDDAELASGVVPEADKIGDILYVPPSGELRIADVSVIDPVAQTYRRAAARGDGAAAAVRDRHKAAAYRRYNPHAYDFVALSHETFGRLSKGALSHLKYLADIAVECGIQDRAQYITNVKRELSVGLCRGNALLFRMGLQIMTGVSGKAAVAGRIRPVAEL